MICYDKKPETQNVNLLSKPAQSNMLELKLENHITITIISGLVNMEKYKELFDKKCGSGGGFSIDSILNSGK